jgi:hypothetical protein
MSCIAGWRPATVPRIVLSLAWLMSLHRKANGLQINPVGADFSKSRSMAQQSNGASGDPFVQPIAAGSGDSDVIPLIAPQIRVVDRP